MTDDKKHPGPPSKRLVIKTEWTDAVKQAMAKGKPPKPLKKQKGRRPK